MQEHTTRIKKKDALLKSMIKPFWKTKNKKIIDRLKALEKSFHLRAIPLFQLNSFRNGKGKRAMGSCFDFAEKQKVKNDLRISIFSIYIERDR